MAEVQTVLEDGTTFIDVSDVEQKGMFDEAPTRSIGSNGRVVRNEHGVDFAELADDQYAVLNTDIMVVEYCDDSTPYFFMLADNALLQDATIYSKADMEAFKGATADDGELQFDEEGNIINM